MEILSDTIDVVHEKAPANYNEWFIPNCSMDIGSENKLIGNNRFNITSPNNISEKNLKGAIMKLYIYPVNQKINLGTKIII